MMFWKVFIFATVGALSGALGFWASDRSPPVTVVSATVVTPVVRPGGYLRVDYRVIRHASCETLLQRIVMDSKGTRLTLPDINFKSSPGPMGADEYSVVIPIPTKTASGEGWYRSVTSYTCNPIHHWWPITVLAADARFVVEGAPIISEPVEVLPLR